jgi:hypothetical protein
MASALELEQGNGDGAGALSARPRGDPGQKKLRHRAAKDPFRAMAAG